MFATSPTAWIRMSTPIELAVGRHTWPVTVRPDAEVALHRPPVPPAPAAGPRELVAAALENPLGLEAPLRRAVTPDDRVALVLDERLPHIPELLAGVLEHLRSAGIDPGAVTILVPPGETGNSWVDELPDEFADVRLEVHDPEERKNLAYLATTKGGRRIYLNRTLVEADFVVVLTGRRYDPTTGYAGAEVALFPALGDAETLAGCVGQFRTEPPRPKPRGVRAEAAEIGWLFGTPFFVQVIEGSGDTVQEVLAALPDRTADGITHQDARWRASVAERPDLVVAAVSGSPERVDFLAVAQAAAAAEVQRLIDAADRVLILPDAQKMMVEVRQHDVGENPA
jgi:nickel-dependent lactate racemase